VAGEVDQLLDPLGPGDAGDVETIRGSRSENCSAAAATGTSWRSHAVRIASIRASSSGAASR
jgi:hypothetical protein